MKKIAKNRARTARRQLEGRHSAAVWRIFAELHKPKRALSEDELNGKHAVSMF